MIDREETSLLRGECEPAVGRLLLKPIMNAEYISGDGLYPS